MAYDTIPNICYVLNRYVSSSGAKFKQVASKFNKFMKL